MANTAEKTQAPTGDTGGGMAALGRRAAGVMPGHASLNTEHGQTRIAERVVAKIASMAAREIPGVQAMGKGLARRTGQLRGLMPGADGQGPSQTGVSVQVGERETAIDLDVVTWYGQSIAEVTDTVRRNVIDRVQGMTSLNVVEVNINVDDIAVEGEQAQPSQEQSGQQQSNQ